MGIGLLLGIQLGLWLGLGLIFRVSSATAYCIRKYSLDGATDGK